MSKNRFLARLMCLVLAMCVILGSNCQRASAAYRYSKPVWKRATEEVTKGDFDRTAVYKVARGVKYVRGFVKSYDENYNLIYDDSVSDQYSNIIEVAGGYDDYPGMIVFRNAFYPINEYYLFACDANGNRLSDNSDPMVIYRTDLLAKPTYPAPVWQQNAAYVYSEDETFTFPNFYVERMYNEEKLQLICDEYDADGKLVISRYEPFEFVYGKYISQSNDTYYLRRSTVNNIRLTGSNVKSAYVKYYLYQGDGPVKSPASAPFIVYRMDLYNPLPEAITLKAAENECLVGQVINLTVESSVAGVELVIIDNKTGAVERKTLTRTNSTISYPYEFSSDEACSKTVYAIAGGRLQSTPIQLSVTAPYGQLTQPELVTCRKISDTNNEYIVTWTTVSSAKYYAIECISATGELVFQYMINNTQSTVVLDVPGDYTIRITAHGTGYVASNALIVPITAVDPREAQYSSIFDYDYYVQQNPDIEQYFAGDRVAIIDHFIAQGMAEGRPSHPEFNVQYYRANNPDIAASFGDDLALYYQHYMYNGKDEGRVADRLLSPQERPPANIEEFEARYNAIYSYEYYTEKYPVFATAYAGDRTGLLNFFITTGMAAGHQAHPDFNVDIYREKNPDLVAVFGDNLAEYYLHFQNSGKAEGRIASNIEEREAAYSAVYNFEYYAAQNADIAQAYGGDRVAILAHFVNSGMSEGRPSHPDFNVHYYMANNPDLQSVFGNDPKSYYMHYQNYGKAEGRVADRLLPPDYGALEAPYSHVYNFDYYAAQNGDVATAFGGDRAAILNHFVNSGMSEGRASHPNFNVNYYMANNPDLQSVFGNDRKSYYLHYQNQGKAEGRVADRLLPPDYGALEAPYSHVYDFDYYVSQNGDVAAACGGDRAAILAHFVNSGMSEGRASHPNFNVNYYMANNPDLQSVFGNDPKSYYMHYQNYGKAEGRVANRLIEQEDPTMKPDSREAFYASVYDYEYYLEKNPDVAAMYGGDRQATMSHFIDNGMAEGRRGSGEFNVHAYRANYPDLEAAFGGDLKDYYMHYINNGKAEGRSGR